MANAIRIDGLEDFLAELARLAPELAAEAKPLQAAEAGAEALRAAYPVVTGDLRNSVVAEEDSSDSEARVFAQVLVTSDHAGYYEFGTAHSAPHPTFTPIMRRAREAFLQGVIAKVRARGLQVQGGPANG